MPKLTVICHTRSQPWRYGHHPRGSRMQQRTHVNITATLDIRALLLAEQSLGESAMAFSPSTHQRLRLSEYLEALLPMECVPEISICPRASSESRISPLTASVVTRATTSLHTGPPFIVVRLVRELMSVRVPCCQISVTGNTQFL